jgi:hypothetical protein
VNPIHLLAGAITGALREIPKNDQLWSYTIHGFDGSPYIDRTLFPRVLGRRLILHKIWRADEDPWLHNHPWRTARFLIISGGYTERRLVDGVIVHRQLRPGEVNELDASTYHRVDHAEPNTWTLGLIGERCQDWGFLVDDSRFVTSASYFASRGHIPKGARP